MGTLKYFGGILKNLGGTLKNLILGGTLKNLGGALKLGGGTLEIWGGHIGNWYTLRRHKSFPNTVDINVKLLKNTIALIESRCFGGGYWGTFDPRIR